MATNHGPVNGIENAGSSPVARILGEINMLFTVKSTKKALRQLCETAERDGNEVIHSIHGDVDNIYINRVLVGEMGKYFANIILTIPDHLPVWMSPREKKEFRKCQETG